MPNISLNKIRSALQRVHRNMHIFNQVLITQDYEIFYWKLFFWTFCRENCAKFNTWYQTHCHFGRTFAHRLTSPGNNWPSGLGWKFLPFVLTRKHFDDAFFHVNFVRKKKSENSRELEWYYLDYVSRFLLDDVGNETIFIYFCLLFIYGQSW